MENLTFNDYLEYFIILEKKKGKIKEKLRLDASILDKDIVQLNKLNEKHHGIKDFYKNVKDGYGLIWYTDDSRIIGGRLKFAPTKYLFADQKEYGMYDDDMIAQNELIQYFQPLDNCTDETRVGFIITPDKIYDSLYYNVIGETELYNLDLNYEGYTQMVVEARAFYNWQRVLLHHEGYSIGEVETEVFKKHMPEIFPDWTWEGFIEKYESLKLSKKA